MSDDNHYPSRKYMDVEEYDPAEIIEVLKNAMSGAGTNEEEIIEVLATKTTKQRATIAKEFKTAYGKDLIDELEGELSGDVRELLIALFDPSSVYDAKCLRKAMKGFGTDEDVLLEILCTRTNWEMEEIIKSYTEVTEGRNLEKDVKSETSGHFQHILISLLQANRDTLTDDQWNEIMESGWMACVDQEAALDDAQKLLDAGENVWGTDESVFNMILAKRQFFQLRAIFNKYNEIADKDITDAIKSELSGDTEKGYLAIVECARNAPLYFATRLGDAIIGVGTDDDTLIRTIVSRAEIDLGRVANEYFLKYDRTLIDDIKGDTSGDYEKLLVAVVQNAINRQH